MDSGDSSCNSVNVDGHGNGKALLQVHGRMSEVLSITESVNQAPKRVGATAPLDEAGYAEVRSTCCNAEMLTFARRVIIDEDLELCSKWGLMGLVPWFTCDQEKSAAGLLQRSVTRRIQDVGIAEELASLQNSQLRKKAGSLGVSEEKLDEAEDSDDLHKALIELIVAAQGNDREKETEHLASLRMSELRHMVKSLDVTNTQLEAAEDSSDRKAAYIDLILAGKGRSTSTLMLTYAGLREAILASKAPTKCAFVASIDSCTTGENLGPDCHGVYGFNDFTLCPANETAPASTIAPTTIAPSTTTEAPTTKAPTTTTLTTTPGTREWVLVTANALCQGATNPDGADAMLDTIGNYSTLGSVLANLSICQSTMQTVLEDPSQTSCSDGLQYKAFECVCFVQGFPPCREWISVGGMPDGFLDIWRYIVVCAERSVSGDCLSCVDGYHLDASKCKSTYLHGALTSSTSVCTQGYAEILSAAECTKAAIMKGLSITSATEISDTTKQAGCYHPIINATSTTIVNILSTEVFFNTAGDTSVPMMATICKASAAP